MHKPEDEYFSPPSLLTLIRAALGGDIAWDLASCATANEAVGAWQIFHKELPFQENHHIYAWEQGFWCNPPQSQVGEFADIVSDYTNKRGVFLAPAATEFCWWHWLAENADTVIFLGRAISFIDPATGKSAQHPAGGQCLFLWDCDPEPLRSLGTVMARR